jgi:hypothetical protein|nr:MAG TPA: Polymer-forming cytoskeletal [Caudoviricetes sp.]
MFDMFKNNDVEIDQSFSTLINDGITINGSMITGEESIRIDGTVEIDSINMSKSIIVSQSGSVNVNKLIANNIIIDGSVNGEIHATDTVYLLEHAILNGDIYAKELYVERGAKFHGSNHVIDGEALQVSSPIITLANESSGNHNDSSEEEGSFKPITRAAS